MTAMHKVVEEEEQQEAGEEMECNEEEAIDSIRVYIQMKRKT